MTGRSSTYVESDFGFVGKINIGVDCSNVGEDGMDVDNKEALH